MMGPKQEEEHIEEAEEEVVGSTAGAEQLRKRVKAIRGRLGEVVGMLREGLQRSNE